jgi:hypothetical protein
LGQSNDVTEEWRKLHIEELNELYWSPNIVLVIKLRKMRLAGHVASMRVGEVHTGFWLGNLRERENLENLSVDGRIKLTLQTPN